ncbi:transcriptional regulator [Aquimarina aggregata]|uniref:Transcriptional regulator n=1 Tax=Aquimarina aggregata TaxID=1642818 RepID=A0A162WMU3_9FLAO|nr:helix-turn-helix domain-containing protein [Aquimarina aggregata]KZS38197.1 transcriptional regulator [Aquimarina aggregata]
MQSILNQLVYFGYLQSIFLLLIYVFSPKNRKNINEYIAIFVLVLMIGLTGRVLFLSGIFGANHRLIVFSEFATLLFGATIYLFTRSSLLGKRFSSKDLLHYAPAFFYNTIATIIFILPSDEIIKERIDSGEQFRNILLCVGIGLIFNITYWIMSLRLFLKFRAKIQNEISYTVQSRFFLNFLIAIGLCLLCWTTMYFSWIVGSTLFNKSAWQIIWLSIASIILFIAFYGMKEPDLYKITSLVKTKKYLQSKLSNEDLTQLKSNLDRLMEEKKPFLNQKLLKSELAEMIGVSNPEIARLLNERIGMNFFEYINYYRIKEFVELAKSDKAKNMTFFGLAQEAGFNSKTTFNKSFKNLMGTTPKDYFSNNTH